MLTKRQKEMLLALYDIGDYPATDFPESFPWLEYGPRGLPMGLSYDPPLRVYLQEKKLVDSGAGAIWRTLDKLKLIRRRHQHLQVGEWHGVTLWLSLTRNGLKLARAIIGAASKKKTAIERPLSRMSWYVLTRTFNSAPRSIDVFTLWRSPPTAYMVEAVAKMLLRRGWVAGNSWESFALTPAGREWYDAHRAEYEERYPRRKPNTDQSND